MAVVHPLRKGLRLCDLFSASDEGGDGCGRSTGDISDGALKVAYSGDTGWFDDLPRQVGESDLFVSECTYHTNVFDLHLNHAQLVEHRDDFACGRVILTHLGSEMAGRRGAAEFETADDGLILQL